MKKYLFFFIFISCGMGSHRPIERKLQDKLWRPCQDFEDPNPIGKLCNRVCVHRQNNKCKEWRTIKKDFSLKQDFDFFRDSSFIFVDEDHL